jgi:hypothetical protein
MSALEALTNAALGLVVSWALTLLALPFWGYTPGPADAAGITAMYFVASFARAWAIREAFRRWAK